MAKPIITVENISKRYSIGKKESYGSLREEIMQALTSPFRRKREDDGADHIWALKDVSFTVEEGDVLGIVGRNGAGKSTLLKILSRITEPTTGKISMRGRVASLLEVGTGFHPELTGRENIFLNGALLGMSSAEIKAKFDEIVAFSEIEKFLDTPVKRYSSGMYVRLAFAVAAHLEPEILIIDEVLAVGDASFQKKCLGKMGDVAKGGRTVLFVSHNMAAVENLCDTCILLNSGSIVRQGDTSSVIRYYIEGFLPSVMKIPLSSRKDRSGSGKVRFTDFHLEDASGNTVPVLQSGKDAVFVFDYTCTSEISPRNVSVGFGLTTGDSQVLFVLYSSYTGQDFKSIPSTGQFKCYMPSFPVAPGNYKVGARVIVGGEEADWPNDSIAVVDVVPGDFFGTGNPGFGGKSFFLVNGSWAVNGQ